MAAKIRWTAEAVRWLESIYDYIAKDSPSAAARVVSSIYGKAQILRTQPHLGWRYEPIHDREIRIILYGHYRIAYLVKSDTELEILGIFHAAMEMDRYLD